LPGKYQTISRIIFEKYNMSLLRKARRQQERAEAKLLNKFVGMSKEQQDLEKQFADTFREYGLDPYRKDNVQFQTALKTHKVI
jgi:hypothetical protein